MFSSNAKSSQFGAMLHIFGDNEAVIKMIIEAEARTHRVAHDCLFDRINLDPKIQIKYVDTKQQLADILTKENFTRDEWNNLLHLFNISHFQINLLLSEFQLYQLPRNIGEMDARRERRREDCGKVKTDVELGLACCDKFFDCAQSDCVEKSGDTQGTLST